MVLKKGSKDTKLLKIFTKVGSNYKIKNLKFRKNNPLKIFKNIYKIKYQKYLYNERKFK